MKFLNRKWACIVCAKKAVKRDSMILINGAPRKLIVPLQKHHVRYFPELIAWVHDTCHRDIHAGLYPHLIQYKSEDSKRFYGVKK